MNKIQTEQFLITSLSSPFHHLHFFLRQPVQPIHQPVNFTLQCRCVCRYVLFLHFENGFDQRRYFVLLFSRRIRDRNTFDLRSIQVKLDCRIQELYLVINGSICLILVNSNIRSLPTAGKSMVLAAFCR